MAFIGLKVELTCVTCGTDILLCGTDSSEVSNVKIKVIPCKKCNSEYEKLKSLLKNIIGNVSGVAEGGER